MTKRLACLLLPAALLSGCGGAASDPVPAPSPAELERLLARVEADARAANPPARGALPDGVAAADRVSNSLARLPAERLDPNLVVSALAR